MDFVVVASQPVDYVRKSDGQRVIGSRIYVELEDGSLYECFKNGQIQKGDIINLRLIQFNRQLQLR